VEKTKVSRTVPFDLQQLLAVLKAKKFFGKVEIEIAHGEPRVLRVAETHLLQGERDERNDR
jgi:hypothetical protein